MVATATLSAYFDDMLKVWYPPKVDFQELYQNNPTMALTKKIENWRGQNVQYPVMYADGNQAVATDSAALTAAQTPLFTKFTVSPVDVYNRGILSRKRMRQSMGDKGAFRDNVKTYIDATKRMHRRALADVWFGDGGNYTGRISDISSDGKTVTLTEKTMACNFQASDYIGLSSDPGTGSLRGSPSYAQIAGVNVNSGQLSFSTSISTSISGASESDYVFIKGRHNDAMAGISGWIPSTAPGNGDSWQDSTDRYKNTTRLAGHRFDFTSQSPALHEMVIESVAQLVGREESNADLIVMSHSNRAELQKSLQAAKVYHEPGLKKVSGNGATVGFKTIQFSGTKGGDLEVIADRGCPDSKVFILDMSTWEWFSTDPIAQLVDDDGNVLSRVSGYDQMDYYCATYGNLRCTNPGANGVILL